MQFDDPLVYRGRRYRTIGHLVELITHQLGQVADVYCKNSDRPDVCEDILQALEKIHAKVVQAETAIDFDETDTDSIGDFVNVRWLRLDIEDAIKMVSAHLKQAPWCWE